MTDSKDIEIIVPDQPQKSLAKWFYNADGETHLIGQTVKFRDADGKHRGLYNTRILDDLPPVFYDRNIHRADWGLLADFIWPSAMVESEGHALVVNSYDRARFTFGYYQLAAHTPQDNLILWFRKLASLPRCREFFPSLYLKNGRVHSKTHASNHSLESVTKVHRPNGKIESQLLSFMTFLNPDTYNVNVAEVLTTARLIHWYQSDPLVAKTYTDTALEILKRKMRRSFQLYDIEGDDPRVGIWIADIRHQGRGTKSKIRKAVGHAKLEDRLEALSQIDVVTAKNPQGVHKARRERLERMISQLNKEGTLSGQKLGSGALDFI